MKIKKKKKMIKSGGGHGYPPNTGFGCAYNG